MPKRSPRDLFQPAPLPVAKLGDAEQLACLRLIRSENVGPVAFRELINLYGGAAKALAALPEIAKRSGRGKPIRICPKADAEAELTAARACGAEPIFTIEPNYPGPLAALDAPPPLLYVKGRPELLNSPSIAIVGSRDSSAAGMKLASSFAAAFAQAGYVVVSGLARGIDGAAHKASIETGTIAVLAGGVDIFYPPEHRALQERIGTEGCLVSEQRPGFSPRGRQQRIHVALRGAEHTEDGLELAAGDFGGRLGRRCGRHIKTCIGFGVRFPQARERFQRRQNVGGFRNQGGTLLDEAIGAFRARVEGMARHGEHFAALLGSVARGDERAGACGRLNDHDGAGNPGYDAVAAWKVLSTWTFRSASSRSLCWNLSLQATSCGLVRVLSPGAPANGRGSEPGAGLPHEIG